MSPVMTSWRRQREGMRCCMTETMTTNDTYESCTRFCPCFGALKPFSFEIDVFLAFMSWLTLLITHSAVVLCSTDNVSSLPSPCVPDLFTVATRNH